MLGGFGHAYGSPNWNLPDNWRQVLELPGTGTMKHLRTLLESKPWWKLVPDVNHTVAVDGRGAFAAKDYAVTARAGDGSFALSYLPSKLTLTVDLSQFAGPRVDAAWFNPRTGDNTGIGKYTEKKHHAFDPPAEGDWVLMLDSATPPDGLAGQKLLVTSVRTGDTEIFIAHPVTGDMTNVTRSPQTEDRYPCWAPEAQWPVGEALELFIINTDGTGARQVTTFGG